MSNDERTRIGDAEREDAIMRLSEAHALGQLDATEFNERTSAASEAKTAGDLARLLEDLPHNPTVIATPPPAPVRTPPADRHELHQRAAEGDEDAQRKVAMTALGTWVLISVITTAIWLATSLTGQGASGYFWPIWPMIGLGIPLVTALARWKLK